MIVDENVDAAQSLGTLVEQMGHHVTLAYSGSDAIEFAYRERPDVIFLDLAMPGLDGYEVARRLRRERHFKNVLIIAVTGHGQGRERRQAREAGFDYHLMKPADTQFIKSLLGAVR